MKRNNINNENLNKEVTKKEKEIEQKYRDLEERENR